MIEIECRDGLWIIKATKIRLVLTRGEFIAAMKRGKAYRRGKAFEQRQHTAQAEAR